MSEPVLKVSDLSVVADGLPVLEAISFEVAADGVVAIAGEPGSGKSLVVLAILGLTHEPGVEVGGEVIFAGRDLIGLSDPALRAIRGEGIGLAFEDPLSSLHPCRRLGVQMVEAIRVHHPVGEMAARDRSIELLEAVGAELAHVIVDRYPHELTTLDLRRASLAIALANGPQLLIADEPTGGLEEPEAAAIEALLRELRCAVIVTTPDRVLAARLADEMLTLEDGRITERLRRHQPEETAAAPEPESVRVRARRGGLLGRWRGRRRS
ncbi:MAG TPA: ATP-binding cassette domain-containing protein [Solirubrobacteraceae bacterium]|nr:ATP-binding cassette domain-containing protein [Solirubrobacteraceae bacterium]